MRFYSSGILFLCIILLSSCTAKTSDISKLLPNIILILTDDQGYGEIGAHGNPNISTPNLDRLHDESVRFTNFHVGTTCAPTRAGLMTGVNCNRTGTWHTVVGRSLLGERFVTLAEELKEEGYTTGIFGKWHLGDNYPFRPQDRGFDEVLIHGGGGVGQTPDFWGNDYFDDTYFRNGAPEKFEGYCTDVWFEESMAWMKESQSAGKPFFSYISTNAPHGPYHVADEYRAPYVDNPEVVNPNFYGMITNLDDNLGRLREMLVAEGLDENTLIVFLTDNGTSGGARFDQDLHVTDGYNAGMRGKKVDEYEGGHRVPLFLRFPAGEAIAPASYEELTAYTDLMPTLVDYLGGEVNTDYALDGQSLLPLIRSGRQDDLTDRVVVVDTQRGDLPVKYKRSCVMRGQWRLINHEELYNLADDPGQRTNIIEQHGDLAADLNAAYERWWSRLEPDLEIMNRIVVGHPAANPVYLTGHDWHTEAEPPWHQRHIRAAHVNNGWWALDVAEAGTYTFSLARWPISLGLSYDFEMPAGEPVPGGEPYSAGASIPLSGCRIYVNDKLVTDERSGASESVLVVRNVRLEAGPIKLQTQIDTGDKMGDLGAYYVRVERTM